MGLFKKKIKKKITKDTFTETPDINIQDIPPEAMTIIYEDKLAEYERCNSDREGYMNSERADTLQKQLAIMSKYMREDSMKPIYDYFEDKGFSKEKLKQADPEQLRRIKQKSQELDTAVKNLYSQEPTEENINITMNMENARKTVDKIKEDIMETDKEIKSAEKDFDVITSPTDSVENEEYIESLVKSKSVQEKVLEEMEKKKPKKKFSLFKKKKLIKKKSYTEPVGVPSQLPATEEPIEEAILLDDVEVVETPQKKEIEALEKIERESNLFKKEIKTPDIKKLFKKKEKEKDIFCPECKHLMKSHKSGCDKCGCLMEMEDIIALEQIAEAKNAKMIEETMEVEPPEVIKKQLKQIESMNKAKPKPEVQKQVSKVEKPEKRKLRLNPNKECTCEHLRKDHFEMTGFCAIKDCYCDEFRKYPHD